MAIGDSLQAWIYTPNMVSLWDLCMQIAPYIYILDLREFLFNELDKHVHVTSCGQDYTPVGFSPAA